MFLKVQDQSNVCALCHTVAVTSNIIYKNNVIAL